MDRPTAPASRTDTQWIGFVGATTGAVTWGLNRFVFQGGVPLEVAGLIQFGVPMLLTALAAEIRWRTARRRAECQHTEGEG